MGGWTELQTAHGPIRAWRARPRGEAVAGLVLVQEIFGVNAHIRDVADRLAGEGFDVVAPSLFDPVQAGVELAYDDAGIAAGRGLVASLGLDRAIDLAGSAASSLAADGYTIGAIGFCWGGTVALLANTRLGLPAVSYYGARSLPFLDEPLRAPMLLHFGSRDASIPPAHIASHREKLPSASIHVHDAGHGFNCEQRADYDPEAAAAAWQQTLAFLRSSLA